MLLHPFTRDLLEFLTTLTFGALRRNHFVSTVFGTIAKPAMHHEYNWKWKGSASVLASMRWLVVGEKRDVTSMTVPKKKRGICNRTRITPQGFFSITVGNNATTLSVELAGSQPSSALSDSWEPVLRHN